ncbi:MAG: AEC family transporter [Clostridia bacterium]|nr:AEC family transporter [Clostridia bacterium]
MNSFFVALITVGVMLFYAVPGFLLVKSKLIRSDGIHNFAKLLMYVCSPMLVIYSFLQVDFSLSLLGKMLFAFAFSMLVMLLVVFLFFVIFKKKSNDARYRIYNLATVLPNCAFMGVPILQAVLPNYPEAVAFSVMFSLSLNIVSWSVGSYVITRDKKYISIKKILVNPQTISLLVAIPLFVIGVNLPSQLDSMITLLAKMSTPLCMLIMGMRLATTPIKGIFNKPMQYLIILIKQMIIPLIVFLILLPLPIDDGMRATMYIIFACPVASVILSFAEMLGEGQETAANMVLLGTSLSAITIPIMCLLI